MCQCPKDIHGSNFPAAVIDMAKAIEYDDAAEEFEHESRFARAYRELAAYHRMRAAENTSYGPTV